MPDNRIRFPSPVLEAPLTALPGQYRDASPVLPLFMEPPQPAHGCPVCAEVFSGWQLATDRSGGAWDPSRATDLAVLISRHTDGHGDRLPDSRAQQDPNERPSGTSP